MRRWILALAMGVGVVGCADEGTRESAAAGEDDRTAVAQQASKEADLPDVQAMSAEEVTALRDSTAKNPWPVEVSEVDSEGRPALLSALVEVRTPYQARALEKLGIYFDKLPLFPEEWESVTKTWPAGPISVSSSHDDVGAFMYALVPARVYNLLRSSALAGNPILPRVVLQPIPTLDARDGEPTRVLYEWLQKQGFTWDLADDTDPLPSAKELEGTYFKQDAAMIALAEKVASDAQKQIALTRKYAIAPAAILASRNVTVNIELEVKNTDPLFNSDPTDTVINHAFPVVQGWGARRGLPVNLVGTKITAKQSGFNSSAKLDQFNHASVSLKKDKAVNWCVKHASDRAIVTNDFFFATHTCHLRAESSDEPGEPGQPDEPVYHQSTSDVLTADDTKTAILATVADSQNWLHDVAVHDPKRVNVLVGPIATAISFGRAFAACGSYYGGVPIDLFEYAIEVLTNFADPADPELSNLILPLTMALGHVDLVIANQLEDDRLIIAHEFGHYAMCSLMAEDSPVRFRTAWTDVIVETLGPQIFGGIRGLENEASWLNEGFADFVASQTTGGVNYFTPGDPGNSISPTQITHYCDGDTTHPFDDACLEVDVVFPALEKHPPLCGLYNATCDALHNQAVGAWATLLLDAFDGHPHPVNQGNQNIPGNGGIWKIVPDAEPSTIDPVSGEGDFGPIPFHSLFYASPFAIRQQPGLNRRKNDEASRLPGFALHTFIEKWTERTLPTTKLKKEDFILALVDTMREHGVPEREICRAIGLHVDGSPGQCTELMPYLNDEMGFDSNATDTSVIDLEAPVALFCKSTQPGTVRCDWEDVTIDNPGLRLFVLQAKDVSNDAVLASDVLSYEIVRGHDFDLPAGTTGTISVSVKLLRWVALDSSELSDPATFELFIPPPPPPGCGNGTIDPNEACDGDVFQEVSCTTPGLSCSCPAGTQCVRKKDCSADCQSLSESCLCTE